MANGLPTEAGEIGAQARRLALALDQIEARLEALHAGSDPDAIIAALAGPIQAFDLAAKES